MFAYVGGLCIFLATFSQILIHYIIRFLLDANSFSRKLYLKHYARKLFVSSDEAESINGAEAGCRSTELHHAATEDIYSQISFDVSHHNGNDDDGMDENDMGNILINASIG